MRGFDGDAFARDGFAVVREVLGAGAIADARLNIPPVNERAGLRNILNDPAIHLLALSPALGDLAAEVFGGPGFITRAILFDKTPGANWAVPWHQDTTIAVKEWVNVPGFGGWTVKDGVPHCHPPVSISAAMVTTRIHLDDCGPANGPLCVIPGSHGRGWMNADEIARAVQSEDAVDCICEIGDVVVMRPTLLHSSRKAESPSHRRVLHLEWAAGDLPGGLEWRQRVFTA